ncbi:hypothetical protein ACQKDD_00175 [Planococcus kocurii]|uniref:hypothetical protein n=1 Tax=Planococcus kocurii TaxID=1374 RepID=UPI000A61E49E|nr:hypothetical protein [Planococcus kocurii]
MNVSLLLSIVMVIVGMFFLILSLLFLGEIQIGAFVASLIIAIIFYIQYKRQKKNAPNN